MENATQRPVKIINFNKAYEPPVHRPLKSGTMLSWGKDNDYPSYIMSLYNYIGSSIHTSIINKKVSFLTGQGFNDVTDLNLVKFLETNDLSDEVIKMGYDLEIFNGFAFECIKSKVGDNIASIKHIPLSQLRYGIRTSDTPYDYFWYSKDWTKTSKYPPVAIDAYNVDNPSKKQIYYYSVYNPDSVSVKYPIPYYSNSINSIETDFQISRFHLNQAKQGYAPSFLLNFATGIPTAEEQDAFYREFENEYSGTENAGKAIVTYSEGKDQEPKFEKIDLNDSDERFLMLQARIENDIVQGSGIPAPLVLLTPGKLGGTEDRNSLMMEFQKSYISPRQIRIESALNKVLAVNNYSDKLTLKNYSI